MKSKITDRIEFVIFCIPEAEHWLAEGDGPLPRLEVLLGDVVLPPLVHLLQGALPDISKHGARLLVSQKSGRKILNT